MAECTYRIEWLKIGRRWVLVDPSKDDPVLAVITRLGDTYRILKPYDGGCYQYSVLEALQDLCEDWLGVRGVSHGEACPDLGE